MATEGDDPPDTAPDLQIRGDEITLQPSGFVESRDREKEHALMKNATRFRSEPLQCVPLSPPPPLQNPPCVSAWR